MNKEYNVLEMLLLKNKKYIVLFSGLNCSPVERIVNDLKSIFNAIDFNFLHLKLDDDISLINERISDLLKKDINKPFFIISKTFPTDKLKIPVNLHINISLNYQLLSELDKTPNLFNNYKDELDKNKINKFIKINKGYNYDEKLSEIFEFIIDNIEKKVYGDKYDKLNHRVYDPNNIQISESKESSKLVFDPNALSYEEKREQSKVLIEKEIQDQIDEDLVEIDEEDSDFLVDEIRMFGSGIYR